MAEKIIEVKYRCKTERCGNEQTIKYWEHEAIMPATCCVKCKAGFGKEYGYAEMAARGMGMLPISA
jgi:hypothetical protein